MENTFDIEAGISAIEAELSKVDSVITVIQQHYFGCRAMHENPFFMAYEFDIYSNLTDVSLEIVQSAKEALATLRQNVEGGVANG